METNASQLSASTPLDVLSRRKMATLIGKGPGDSRRCKSIMFRGEYVARESMEFASNHRAGFLAGCKQFT